MFSRLRDSSTAAAVAVGGGWLYRYNNGFGGIVVSQKTNGGSRCCGWSDCHGDEQLVVLASGLCADDGRGLPESILPGNALVLPSLWSL
jgi:hypothetical protein